MPAQLHIRLSPVSPVSCRQPRSRRSHPVPPALAQTSLVTKTLSVHGLRFYPPRNRATRSGSVFHSLKLFAQPCPQSSFLSWRPSLRGCVARVLGPNHTGD